MMKTTITLICMLVVLSLGARAQQQPAAKLQTGDIVFQTSQSRQSMAIRLATHSDYSHCGLVIREEDGRVVVLEAVQPVKCTPLEQWIAQGEGGHYVAMRLRDAAEALTPQALESLDSLRTMWVGRNYDLYFGWDETELYCSELVWKALRHCTGREVGKTQALRDFDLSHPLVQQKLKDRFGEELPLRDSVVSPGAIFESGLLEEVARR